MQDWIPDDRPTGAESVAPAGREAAPEIELTEQAAIALPGDRLLNGAALSPSGDLVAAWFAGSPGVRVYGRSAPRDILVAEIGHATGVEFLDEEHFEIVDAASGGVVTADMAGVAHSRRGLPGSRQATAAARTATGWILAISDSNSTPSYLRLPEGKGTWVPDSSYMRTLGLSVGGWGALVWQGFSPFRAWRIGVGREWTSVEFERVSADWFDDDVSSALRASPDIWSVTSVVAVGSGYVQTLANRGTDDRLLLWFDQGGRFLRHVAVNAPFGFVAAAAKAPVMLAMRTLNDSELVKYSWERISGATLEHKEARP
ncbi:hypothetical protein [Candidatus Palauibacter sp.]|uniref:hypothetical protein n=1 Tax=Candidatus Palauibacter sp. TaxID=3101350 RepID=UPI003AF2F59F